MGPGLVVAQKDVIWAHSWSRLRTFHEFRFRVWFVKLGGTEDLRPTMKETSRWVVIRLVPFKRKCLYRPPFSASIFLQLYMSYSLNSSKGVIIWGAAIWVIKGDTGSLDYGSCRTSTW